MKAQTSCKKSVYDADRSRFNRAWNRGKDASRIFTPLADDRSETCFVVPLLQQFQSSCIRCWVEHAFEACMPRLQEGRGFSR